MISLIIKKQNLLIFCRTELFRLCTRQNLAGKKVGIVKYARDTRYDENMASTHDW